MKENEVRIIRPKYDTRTGEIKGLYETIGFLIVRGAPGKVFFNHVMIKANPKYFNLTTEENFRFFLQHYL